jgi:hypothetical protein
MMKFNQTATSAEIQGNVFGNIKLSKSDANNVSKVTKMLVDTLRQNRMLWRKELNHWQQARMSRYSTVMPRNFLMQDLYDDIMLDAHLHGITENRTLRTTNKDYIFVDKDGKKNDQLTELIKNKTWFEKFLEFTHKSTYFGTSVIFLKEMDKDGFVDIELVKRHSVVPELGKIFVDQAHSTGFDYKEFPNELVEVQMYDMIGLLEKAAPYTILKRHSWGSWDEFEELFGVPIRIAKLATQNESVKNEVAGWLKEMGSAPYVVFPLGTEIEIKENTKTDAFNVFYMKLQELNRELSKLVLHQTMTTDNGSSKSQGSVHENTLHEIIFADEKKALSILNDKLVPAMRNNGYAIPDGYRIKVTETKDPNSQIKIDTEFLKAGYILPKNYIEETYGTEIETMPNASANPDPAKKP